MTSEQRIDRLERIVKLFTKAGRRVRREVREHESKINYLIDLQMRNEELQRQNEKRFAKLGESQVRTDDRISTLIDFINTSRQDDSLENG
jgi:hypothetical protein